MRKIRDVITLKRLNVLIIVIAIFLRFYQVPERFIFDIDTEYQALLASTIVKDFHIIWIGVSASNIGYYLGPGLTYLTAFLLWITKDPVVLGYFASLIGSFTLLSICFVSQKLFGKKVSFITTVIYGFMPFIINYDRKFWPIFIPLIGVWIFYGLVQSQKNKWWLFLCTFLISISFHIHLSLMLFLPFIIYTFFRSNILTFKRFNLFFLFLNIVIYLIITSPLLVFDCVHNFDNILAPLRFIQNLGKGKTIVHRDISWIFVAYSVGGLYFWIRTKSFTEKMLYGIFILICFAFISYPGPMQDYYTVIIFPFLTITVALILAKFPSFVINIGLLVFIWITSYLFITNPSQYGLSAKKIAIKRLCPTLRNKPYYLKVGAEGRDYNGWYYLFTTYCKQPSRSDVDDMFGWLYQEELNKAPSQDNLIKINAPF